MKIPLERQNFIIFLPLIPHELFLFLLLFVFFQKTLKIDHLLYNLLMDEDFNLRFTLHNFHYTRINFGHHFNRQPILPSCHISLELLRPILHVYYFQRHHKRMPPYLT